jgi:hypothetical protein
LCSVTISTFLLVARVSKSFTFHELRHVRDLWTFPLSPALDTDVLNAFVDVEP